jgi:hypothetical protein
MRAISQAKDSILSAVQRLRLRMSEGCQGSVRDFLTVHLFRSQQNSHIRAVTSRELNSQLGREWDKLILKRRLFVALHKVRVTIQCGLSNFWQ